MIPVQPKIKPVSLDQAPWGQPFHITLFVTGPVQRGVPNTAPPQVPFTSRIAVQPVHDPIHIEMLMQTMLAMPDSADTIGNHVIGILHSSFSKIEVQAGGTGCSYEVGPRTSSPMGQGMTPHNLLHKGILSRGRTQGHSCKPGAAMGV